MLREPKVIIAGGGLAGCEAAYQCLKKGVRVTMYEMRPSKMTEAHKTGDLAELVCSNSFKSLSDASSSGLLKNEMSEFGSLIIESARKARVPAGQALAVDRVVFSNEVNRVLNSFSGFERLDDEVTSIPTEEELKARNEVLIVATGPLTSEALSNALRSYCSEEENLFFYDAIAPIVDAETINMSDCFWGDRYGKGDDDYLNICLNKEQYECLVSEILASEKAPLHKFEETPYFECCLPIEVMIERGVETLRFGPLKPVGFTDPKTGNRPWAVIQLRKENRNGSMLSLVGFQTKMKWPEQKRVFAKIPGLESAEFLRLGSVHRNTYINSPRVLDPFLRLRSNKRTLIAGQLSGVEGYCESSASGLYAGINAGRIVGGIDPISFPVDTMMGALMEYVTCAPGKGRFQPMNANLGLLPPIARKKGTSKADVKLRKCELALRSLKYWRQAQEL